MYYHHKTGVAPEPQPSLWPKVLLAVVSFILGATIGFQLGMHYNYHVLDVELQKGTHEAQ